MANEAPEDSDRPISNRRLVELYRAESLLRVIDDSDEVLAETLFDWYTKTYGEGDLFQLLERHRILFHTLWATNLSGNPVYEKLKAKLEKLYILE